MQQKVKFLSQLTLLQTKQTISSAIIFLFLLLTNCYADSSSHQFSSVTESDRYNTLIQETRCIVCQNQSLAESNAPLALDLRDKIYRMIINKKTDAEIKNYLVQRYGEFILLRPRFNKLTLVLWSFPLIGLGLIIFFFFRLTKSTT